MRRGFKAEAERRAAEIRERLDLRHDAPVDLRGVAALLGIEVYAADELVPREDLEALEVEQEYAFSAATFEIGRSRVAIVYNPLHSSGRINSSIGHELAHRILSHRLASIQRVAGVPFISCDATQEKEANWLSGCLLLPRPLLVSEAYAGADKASLAEKYTVTEDFAGWRLNVSGVNAQVRRSRR